MWYTVLGFSLSWGPALRLASPLQMCLCSGHCPGSLVGCRWGHPRLAMTRGRGLVLLLAWWLRGQCGASKGRGAASKLIATSKNIS